MEFERYYQEELAYLHQTGTAFARVYPKLAPLLASGSNDPDVERLLQGFAFLTARIRRQLDDELPQLVHGMYSLLWPELLRPQPSYTMMRFYPIKDAVSECQVVRAGAEVESVPVDGTRCRFRLCWPVMMQPLQAGGVGRASGGDAVQLRLHFNSGVDSHQLQPDPLRLHLHGDPYSASMLYLYLLHELAAVNVKVETSDGVREISLPASCVAAGGFADDETLLPESACAYPGHRLWREYYSFPAKFLFIDVHGLVCLRRLPAVRSLVISFVLRRALPRAVQVNDNSLLLYCAPAVNLFAADAEPVNLDHGRASYRVLPVSYRGGHRQVFSIDRVTGWDHRERRQREFSLFLSPQVAAGREVAENGDYFYPLLLPKPFGEGLDSHVVFLGDACDRLRELIVSLSLTCSNENLPAKLQVGEVRLATGSSPECAGFSNLCVPTRAMPPPTDPQGLWRLLANVTANIGSQMGLAGLRRLLTSCNYAVAHDQQVARHHNRNLQALVDMQCSAQSRLHRGLPLCGWRVDLAVRGSLFASEGDLYLFCNILRHFLEKTAGINEFSELSVQDVEQKGIYEWMTPVMTAGSAQI